MNQILIGGYYVEKSEAKDYAMLIEDTIIRSIRVVEPYFNDIVLNFKGSEDGLALTGVDIYGEFIYLGQMSLPDAEYMDKLNDIELRDYLAGDMLYRAYEKRDKLYYLIDDSVLGATVDGKDHIVENGKLVEVGDYIVKLKMGMDEDRDLIDPDRLGNVNIFERVNNITYTDFKNMSEL